MDFSSTGSRSMLLHRKFVEGASQPRRSNAMLEPAVIVPSAFTVARPQGDEYAPYYERYISLVQGDDILNTLDQQRREMMLLLSCRDEEEGNFRYAPEKWSAKEFLATSATPSASSPTVPCESRGPTQHLSRALSRTTMSAMVDSRNVRLAIWSKNSSRCGARRSRCCAISTKRRGCAAVSP